MTIELTEEQLMLQRSVRTFVEREVIPVADKIDREAKFPAELVARMAELGLMGIAVPTEHGGAGMDFSALLIAIEEVARGCASLGIIMSAHNALYCEPVLCLGTDEQKERWLVPFASGKKIGAFATTESHFGSDPMTMRTSAVRDGDEWVLNGSKQWITNGPQADSLLVSAWTDPSAGREGLSMFIVDSDSPGFSTGKPSGKMCSRAASNSEVYFQDCRVPKEALLGDPGDGMFLINWNLGHGGLWVSAHSIGIARAALEHAQSYAQERMHLNGRPIGAFQAIQLMIADMHISITAAKHLLQRAGQLKSRGEVFAIESGLAKVFCSEMVTQITHDALQIHGGNGLSSDYPLERHYRDARGAKIYGATNELIRSLLGGMFLGLVQPGRTPAALLKTKE